MQKKIKNILIITVWVFICVAILLLVIFFNHQKAQKKCSKLHISINLHEEHQFVNEDSIKNILIRNNIKVKNQPIANIDLLKIEKLLNNNAYIEKANVYASVEGEIFINIIQRRPIVRVINTNGISYYIDDKGKLMKFSQKYSARLVLANGKINSIFNNQLCLEDSGRVSNDTTYKQSRLYQIYMLAKYLDKNKFWKSQIDQIYINEQNEIELIPLVGGASILLGSIENMEEKFDNLFFFYKKVLSRVGYNNYRTINLKYKNQIVCSKI